MSAAPSRCLHFGGPRGWRGWGAPAAAGIPRGAREPDAVFPGEEAPEQAAGADLAGALGPRAVLPEAARRRLRERLEVAGVGPLGRAHHPGRRRGPADRSRACAAQRGGHAAGRRPP
eukprot:9374206-Pyramimonas_sp.AAC.1